MAEVLNPIIRMVEDELASLTEPAASVFAINLANVLATHLWNARHETIHEVVKGGAVFDMNAYEGFARVVNRQTLFAEMGKLEARKSK